ncbi:MAG: hypothetical protein KBA51_02420 [Kiritimatiellae bacterium]|nr:hypothetical protein [Kiritimatiellia bacterium]
MAARRQMACVALIAMAVAGACWARMGTFATGEDPATYIRLAKRVLESGFSLQSLVEIVDFLAPVFPLWVTAIVGLAGPLAVYVVHPVLWVALMVITARWATCVFREERPLAVCWMGVLIPIFLIGGYPLNIHFLLLPFRETMALAMAVAGLLVWLRAVQRASFGLGLLAGALVLLTIGIREPMLLAFVGPTLVSMVATRRGRGSARPIWGLLTLPLVSAAGALLLLLSGRLSPNLQMHLWWKSLTAGAFGARYLARLGETAGWIPGELGWVGLLGLVWSAVRARRKPELLWSFATPAVLFLLFHAGYTPHRRYFLMTLFFVSPLSAWGLFDAIHTGLRMIRSPARLRFVSRAAWTTAAIGLAWTIAGVQPWGARVGWRDVRRIQHLFQALPTQGAVVHETSRRVAEVLENFTSQRLLVPNEVPEELACGRPVSYVWPLNRDARDISQTHGADPARYGSYYAEFSPSKFAPQQFSLGRANYGLALWRPKQRDEVKRELLLPASTRILWFDFGHRTSTTPVNIHFSTPSGAEWVESVHAAGWIPIAIPAAVASETERLRIRITDPDHQLSASMNIAAQDPSRSMRFSLTDRRSLSCDVWVDGTSSPEPGSKWAAAFEESIRLHIPAPSGAPVRSWSCILFLLRRSVASSSSAPDSAETMIRIASPGLRQSMEVVWPSHRSVIPVAVSGDLPPVESSSADFIPLEIRISQPVRAAITELRVGYDLIERGAAP